MLTVARQLKGHIVPQGIAPRRVVSGAFRGLTMDLDLATNLQDYLGLAERELARHVRRLTRGARAAIDVGAAQGWYATYFLSRGIERVIAIEPHQPHVAALNANVRRNCPGSVGRLTTIAKCVGACRAGEHDDVMTLDDLLPLPTPIVIKLDIEGFEVDALRGATEMLWAGDVRWIIETHAAHLERECERLLRGAGYRTRIIRPAWWRRVVPEARVIEHNQWLVATKYV